ncbi:hypothetical protein B9G54_02565 [Alloscardovia macacae]|uniref:Uncharacterized protein n=1 Tax=Alloscardovia macacae TaxID=1160091 RepID=A0A1Y2SVB8_9BIFI|nr:hypothetical protein B9G54_02565 [Alloscardovia macacae]OTA30079.1 hypothetical protein B9T39_01585 [Alloscardovia macacae]
MLLTSRVCGRVWTQVALLWCFCMRDRTIACSPGHHYPGVRTLELPLELALELVLELEAAGR